MSKWQTKLSQIVFSCPFFNVRKDLIKTPFEENLSYWVVERNDFSIVLPVDSQNNIYFVKQYRHPVSQDTLELPMGTSLNQENLLTCAKRELLEETGIMAEKWEKIGEFFTANGFTAQKAEVFLALNLNFGVSQPDQTEILTTEKIQTSEISHYISTGKIKDGPTLAALNIYQTIYQKNFNT